MLMNSVRTMTREIGVPHTHNPSWVVSSDDGALHRVLDLHNYESKIIHLNFLDHYGGGGLGEGLSCTTDLPKGCDPTVGSDDDPFSFVSIRTPDAGRVVKEGRALRQQEAATALHRRDPPDRRRGLLPRLVVGDATNGGVKKTDQRRYQPVGGSEYDVLIILGSKRENPSETDSSNTRFSKASAST
ncbi:unnamed protein product, partial [Musa acuminata subsp. burmannicoides]